METMTLYRYTVTCMGQKYVDCDIMRYILLRFEDFSIEDSKILIDYMMKIQEIAPYPDIKYANAEDWLTEKGYLSTLDYYDKIRKLLKIYNIKVVLHIQCININDRTIMSNDGMNVQLLQID